MGEILNHVLAFKLPYRRLQAFAAVVLSALFTSADARGQLYKLTQEEMIKYTAGNPYGRFPDGRPKVPDEILEKVKSLCAELAVMTRSGYPSQFYGDLEILNPGKTLVGRAFTMQLMPARGEIASVIQQERKEKGLGYLSHQTALDMLQPGDVIVIDAFGSVPVGGIIGDNLAYYIWKTTGTGFVVDGPIRDLQGIAEFDMPGYYKGAGPGSIHGVMVTGINIPVRIGNTTVMPGDVVLGDREGVTFIPPHLVGQIVEDAEITQIHDEWTRMKFDEGGYKSSDIYSRPRDPELIKEYEEYLKERLDPKVYEEYQQRMKAFRKQMQQPRR